MRERQAWIRAGWGLCVVGLVWSGCIDPGSSVDEPDQEMEAPDAGDLGEVDSGADLGAEADIDTSPDADAAPDLGCMSDADCASALPGVVGTCGAGGACQLACAEGAKLAPGDRIEVDGCACVPGPEVCDGADNDCDGQVDEDFAGLGEACEDGLGACAGMGMKVCAPDGMGVVCLANGAQPMEELCGDMIDNDCDGQVDEGCDDDGDDHCDRAMTVVGTPAVCPKGAMDCDDTAADVYPGAPGKCDGKDNDCDGRVDDYKIVPDVTQHKTFTLNGNATMTDATYLNPTVMAAPMDGGFCVGSVNQEGTGVKLNIQKVDYAGNIVATCSRSVTRRHGDTGNLFYRIYDMKTVINGCAMLVGYTGSARPSTALNGSTVGGYDLMHFDTAANCVSDSEVVNIGEMGNVTWNGEVYNKSTPTAAIGTYYRSSNIYRGVVGYTFVDSDGAVGFNTRQWTAGGMITNPRTHLVDAGRFELSAVADSAYNSYFLFRKSNGDGNVYKVTANSILSLQRGDQFLGSNFRVKSILFDTTGTKMYAFGGTAYDRGGVGLLFDLVAGGTVAVHAFNATAGTDARYAGRHLWALPLTGQTEVWGINPGNASLGTSAPPGTPGTRSGVVAIPGNPPYLLAVDTKPGDKGYVLAMTSPSPLAVKLFPFTCH